MALTNRSFVKNNPILFYVPSCATVLDNDGQTISDVDPEEVLSDEFVDPVERMGLAEGEEEEKEAPKAKEAPKPEKEPAPAKQAAPKPAEKEEQKKK